MSGILARRVVPRPAVRLSVGVAALVLLAGACSSGTKSSTATTSAPTATSNRGSGPVQVLYAGSLVNTMTKTIGPAFDAATGYTFTGKSGDSGTLANELLAGTTRGDVFVSASPSKDMMLEGSAGKNLISWYATWATSPVVLGYNPHSRFADDLKSKPWYQVLTEPGILIGRTDPATDPKGMLTAKALNDAATKYGAPGLATIAASTSTVFPETTLVGRLQSGQLDVGFFYAVEAASAHLSTVPLTGESAAARYTITILTNAAHAAGAEAFVKFLLEPSEASTLGSGGLTLINPPTVSGTGMPAGLNAVIP